MSARRRDCLSAESRISHVFALDVPIHDRRLFIRDAVIAIPLDLAAVADIVRNAIDPALALGIETPCTTHVSAGRQ